SLDPPAAQCQGRRQSGNSHPPYALSRRYERTAGLSRRWVVACLLAPSLTLARSCRRRRRWSARGIDAVYAFPDDFRHSRDDEPEILLQDVCRPIDISRLETGGDLTDAGLDMVEPCRRLEVDKPHVARSIHDISYDRDQHVVAGQTRDPVID